MILEDEKFLSDLFGQLRDAKTSEDRRKELVSMMLNVAFDDENLKIYDYSIMMTNHLSWKFFGFFISNLQVLFLKEFCQFSQTLQPQSRESFYKTLSNLGVLPGNYWLFTTINSHFKDP